MRTSMFRTAAGGLTLTLALALAACGGSGGGSDDGGAASDTLIVENAFQLTTLDPARMFEPTGNMIDRVLYDTLLTFEGDDVTEPVPSLAESYEASDDAKTFTFTLRDDAVFSDGSPVTSEDVVFSLTRVANVKGNPSFLMDGLTATAPDDTTVVITSEVPNAAIPFILPNPALGIVNSEAVRAGGGTDEEGADQADTAETALNTESQGSGPYILDSYSTTTEVVLSANPEYWGEAPTYQTVIVRNVQANVQKLDVISGESQIAVDLSPAQAEGVDGVQVISGASPSVFFLLMNQDPAVSEITSNPDFQEAVRFGVDYEGLVSLAGSGAVQAAGIIPSMFLGTLPPGEAVERDVGRAADALERSGLDNPSVTLSYPSDVQVNGLNFGDLAARVQENLAEVGITVELNPAPVQTALEDYRNGANELGLWQWGPDYPDPQDYLVFTPGQLVGLRANWTPELDPDMTALAEQARGTVSDEERAPMYEEIQRQLNTSSPFVPLIQPAQILVAGESVGNVASNALWLVNISELT